MPSGFLTNFFVVLSISCAFTSISFITLKVCLVGFVIFFIILPLIFRFCVPLQRGILFLTFITYPPNIDFSRPEKSGLCAVRNYYVTHRDDEENADIELGVWHLLPGFVARRFARQLNVPAKALLNITDSESETLSAPVEEALSALAARYDDHIGDEEKQAFFEEVLAKVPCSVVLYLHGNTASRAAPHRVELFQVLQRMGYHVVALDYRGYGDSGRVQPTEAGVVRDALAIFAHIRERTDNPVFLWGHSLGTGVSTHMLALMHRTRLPAPPAVVLESPFNNIREEIREHPFSKFYRHLPWFDFTISQPMYVNSLRFESDVHIGEFPQPVLILHAEDDLVVPFKLGYKLYRRALDVRRKAWGPVEFHRFEGSSHYGHKFICRAPNLPDIVRKFFDTYRNEKF
ncbi:lysophosphatidylserine lipase ABHD12 isoform X2 [Phlebotomus argentipes]|uniref:lysophosphatidylserine lipase ABHD12 isoform X2 n=1 Tax=Phlebotomus argentipes TaxID=94469 RepID=UPI0028933315|nr:lysophosphatidylserine lipase ABHD12 isoform X2 [Phlebotomus argentipes]